MTRLPLLGNETALRQGVALLALLSDEEYCGASGGQPPVGPQYRHMLEHYQAFLRGVRSGRIDYDARARDPLLERSRGAALALTRECLDALAALRDLSDGPVQVQMTSEPGAGPDWRTSSAGRELQFLLSHTLHHYALIGLLLPHRASALGPEFGVAPATLSHRRKAGG